MRRRCRARSPPAQCLRSTPPHATTCAQRPQQRQQQHRGVSPRKPTATSCRWRSRRNMWIRPNLANDSQEGVCCPCIGRGSWDSGCMPRRTRRTDIMGCWDGRGRGWCPNAGQPHALGLAKARRQGRSCLLHVSWPTRWRHRTNFGRNNIPIQAELGPHVVTPHRPQSCRGVPAPKVCHPCGNPGAELCVGSGRGCGSRFPVHPTLSAAPPPPAAISPPSVSSTATAAFLPHATQCRHRPPLSLSLSLGGLSRVALARRPGDARNMKERDAL